MYPSVVGPSARVARPAVAAAPKRSTPLRVLCTTARAPDATKAPATTTPPAPPTKVDLPPLSQGWLPASSDLPAAAFGAQRRAQALIYEPQNVEPGKRVPAVVFGHGFSQPPTNYTSTLQRFAQEGWLVIAPTTSIINIITDSIETTDWRSKAPAKLQTALVLDTLRSVQYLKQVLSKYEVGDLLLCGHSMGAATTLVAASKLKDLVKGVGVMAPAVKQTLETAVNPLLHMDGRPESTREAVEFFAGSYPSTAPLTILGGKDDYIVTEGEVTALHAAATAGDASGDLCLYWLDGSHIGFEDSVDVEVDIPGPVGVLQDLLFKVINFLLYRAEITRPITGDYSDQRRLTQEVLTSAFRDALAGAGTDANVQRSVIELKAVTAVTAPSAAAVSKMDADLAAKPQDAPWQLQTALLLSYSGVHAASFAAALHLWSASGADLSTFSKVGLAAVTGLAAGLVYENAVLAAGRFITDNGTKNIALLDALNDPRFWFHSAAPLLCITGVDLADRAGVAWATSPVFVGLTTLLSTGVVGLSLVRNTLLLQTKPTWSSGIFHFTYDDKGVDVTRIIPVALTTLLLTILGGASALHDHALLPFALGPAVCLALSAGLIPRKVAPMILTGNAGEVALVASLVYTQYQLLNLL